MSDKNHNLNCAHRAEIVSYLYNEIGKSEKAVFESHLANCRNCADELADFSFARFAVGDWRDAEFAHLKTPAVEIPFETREARETVSADSGALLADWRRIFSLSPVWTTNAAALAVIVGLILTATNLFQPDMIAEKETVNSADKQVLSAVKSEAQPLPALSAEAETANTIVKSSALPNKNDVSEKREIVRQNRVPENRKNSVVKASVNSLKIKNTSESSENIAASGLKNSSNPAPQRRMRTGRPVPTLNSFEEEEDNTLRLSEMFEEIDAGR